MKRRFFATIFALAIALPAFAQAPVAKPQPDQPAYGISALDLFPTFTRETYRAAFGPAAPCDPNRPLKTWFDLTALDPVVAYKVVRRSPEGLPAYEDLILSAQEASTVNLAGREPFPVYTPQPTKATQVNPATGRVLAPVGAHLLSTREQADRFALIIGGFVVENPGSPSFPFVFPEGEERRVWKVLGLNGEEYVVGYLLQAENSAGVGHPGTWVRDGSRWAWIAEFIPDCADKTDERPVPARTLLPNEQLSQTIFGSPQVVRTDKNKPPEVLHTVHADGFTSADRALLQAIAAALGLR